MKKTLTGVLLMNLGTPEAPTVPAVRRYLREFLSDPRVIDLPALARWLLLNLVILPFRPRQSARAYQKIWSEKGSPLLINSQALTEKLAASLGEQYVVALGMRYGKPSIQNAIKVLQTHRCEKIIVLPLFPQYSSAATGSALEKTLKIIRTHWNIPHLIICNDFYNDRGFIQAQAMLIKESITQAKPEHIVFSYHGLPERHVLKSGCLEKTCDRNAQCPKVERANRFCYRAQCFETSELLAEALNISKDNYSVSFQSRLGRTPWIKPYTDLLLPTLAGRGVRNIAVVCPSFVSDCLETLEEIGIRAREQWKTLGGKTFTLIPCLNAHPNWVKVVADRVKEYEGMNYEGTSRDESA